MPFWFVFRGSQKENHHLGVPKKTHALGDYFLRTDGPVDEAQLLRCAKAWAVKRIAVDLEEQRWVGRPTRTRQEDLITHPMLPLP